MKAGTEPQAKNGLSRRTFLSVTATAAGGMLVALYFDLSLPAQGPAAGSAVKYPPAAFVEIRPDGKIVIQVNRLEFGQGVATALPQLLADEMDADWAQVMAELAPAADIYRDPMRRIQMVGGSGSIRTSFQQYRELGARARGMLVEAAAARWKVAPAQCWTEASVVHGPSGQSAKYAELAAEAARLPVPETVHLKKPAEFRLVGKPAPRLDSRPKCDGSMKFGLDLDLPGMKVAMVVRPPVFGGKVKSFDDKNARSVAGVRDVFEIPLVKGASGVAVVADGFWPASQGRERLQVEWDLAGVERADSSRLWAQYRELARKPGNAAAAIGNDKAMDAIPIERRLEVEYEFPYLPHTPMEPLNTTVRFDGDRAEVWAGSQFQTVDQAAIAEVLGLKPAQVTFHTEFTGGGFGRRAVTDSHVQREAAEIAKRMRGVPVKLIWAREDDVQGGYYRPMHVHHAEIGIGADGMPVAWRHVIVGQSLLEGTPFAGGIKNGVDDTVTEGVADTHYDVPNFHVWAHHPKVNVPVLWWRSVGNTHTAFVMETLVDELAMRAKMDPFAYRRKLLNTDAKDVGTRKVRAALDLLEAKSAWRNSVPKGHAVGIASHESFGTGVACAAEVSVENGRPRIHRVTLAADLGIAVNPLSVESQFQGGIIFGLSQLVPGGAITLKDGEVEQRNFDAYRAPYMADAPLAVDVHIVPSVEDPTGVGEPPVPVIAPAVVNALAQLTGKRYRKLPLESL